MTTNEIGFLIDTVCGKFGSAVDQARPIAETIIQQYVAGHYTVAGIAAMLSVVVAGITVWLFRCARKPGADIGSWSIGIVLCCVIQLGLLGAAVINLYCAIAPLPSILNL